MKNMRQLINLMEGVAPVPGVGVQPGGAGGQEADMQTAGTAARNNSYAAFDAAQTPATEEVMEEPESPAQVVSCNQSNPANAREACAMEGTEQEQHSPEVQQALADFENVVVSLGMAPEDAFDRITQRLSAEGADEFRAALEARGQEASDGAEEADQFITNHLNGADDTEWPARDSDSRTAGPPEDYNAKDYGSDAMEEEIELGDHDDAPAWYIYDQNKKICGGPFESEMEANRASRGYHWFNYGDHEIQPGFDVDGQFMPDDHDEINNPVQEDFNLNNGYDDINDADGEDYFPSGADSPVVKATGPSGARMGDNPEQKKMQVDEVHKELVYGYRNFLKESTKK